MPELETIREELRGQQNESGENRYNIRGHFSGISFDTYNTYAYRIMYNEESSTEQLSEEVEKILDDIDSGKEKVTRYDNVHDYLKHLGEQSEE